MVGFGLPFVIIISSFCFLFFCYPFPGTFWVIWIFFVLIFVFITSFYIIILVFALGILFMFGLSQFI